MVPPPKPLLDALAYVHDRCMTGKGEVVYQQEKKSFRLVYQLDTVDWAIHPILTGAKEIILQTRPLEE